MREPFVREPYAATKTVSKRFHLVAAFKICILCDGRGPERSIERWIFDVRRFRSS